MSYSLINFQIQKYYQKEPKFYGVYSKHSLPKIMEVKYIINLDEYKKIGTHWIALYINDDKINEVGEL